MIYGGSCPGWESPGMSQGGPSLESLTDLGHVHPGLSLRTTVGPLPELMAGFSSRQLEEDFRRTFPDMGNPLLREKFLSDNGCIDVTPELPVD